MYSDDNATRVAKVGNASSVSLPPDLYDFANQKMITPKYNTDWQDELYQTLWYSVIICHSQAVMVLHVMQLAVDI
jgi:hypothetical protein